MTPHRSILLTLGRLASGLLGLALIAACRPAVDPSPAKPTGYHKTIDKGPVSLTLDTDRLNLSIAEHLQLTLCVDHDEDYDITLPPIGDKLEQFLIRDYRTGHPELLGTNRVRRTRTYVLEPFLSGDYVIPSMQVTFTPRSAVGTETGKTYTVESEPFTVHVTSLLPADIANLQIHEIGPPVDLPPPDRRPLIAAILIVFAAIPLLAYLIHRIRRRTTFLPATPPRLPHDIAYDELRALVARRLIEQGLIKPFYQEVSDILRRYIENRFGLRAPEQTTEEFLSDLGHTRQLPPAHHRRLQDFLKHCDLVKFAEHHPTTEDIQATFDSCKAFIAETRESTPGPRPAAEEAPHAL